MPSQECNTALKIELSPLLAGGDPYKWIEEATHALLDADGQTTPPVTLRPSLLHKLRINTLHFEDALAEPGHVRVDRDGFLIAVRSDLGDTPARWRLVVAHEVSHVLLYDSSTWPPRRRTLSPLGNRFVEDLCWYGARCLLMPADVLRVAGAPRASDSPLDSDGVMPLAERFEVSQYAMASRLVHDLGLVRAVVLGFQAKRQDVDGHVVTTDWRLRWHVRPLDSQGLYIPSGQRGGTLPRAHGALAEFLSGCLAVTGGGRFGRDEVNAELFRGRTTGSLYRVLSGRTEVNRVGVLWHGWTAAVQQDGFWPTDTAGRAFVTIYVLL